MASSSPPGDDDVRPGQVWYGVQQQHRGWVVLVTKVSKATISFTVLRGPGNSLRHRQRMGRAKFLADYTR